MSIWIDISSYDDNRRLTNLLVDLAAIAVFDIVMFILASISFNE
jgi:hypothetical protein